MELIFEWNINKAKSNLQKHQIAFEEAKTVFYDPLLLTYPDEFHSDHEDRMISIGYSSQQQLLLAQYSWG